MRILVVEDDLEILHLIESGLKAAGFEISLARDGQEALDLATVPKDSSLRLEFDAAIVDLMLPQMDGLTFISKLRLSKINMPILILSAKRSVDDRIAGLEAGGDDYLIKPFVFAELLARINALLRRSHKGSEMAIKVGPFVLDLISREISKGDLRLKLQPKEFSLLECFFKHPNEVLTKTRILKAVWDYDFDPQTNVVDVLVSRLRTKIDESLDAKAIETIRGVGYVFKTS